MIINDYQKLTQSAYVFPRPTVTTSLVIHSFTAPSSKILTQHYIYTQQMGLCLITHSRVLLVGIKLTNKTDRSYVLNVI